MKVGEIWLNKRLDNKHIFVLKKNKGYDDYHKCDIWECEVYWSNDKVGQIISFTANYILRSFDRVYEGKI
jgi:hypothetical protein